MLNAVGAGETVEWLRYDGWGMVVPPTEAPEGVPHSGQWRLQLGPNHFEQGPLATYGGANALAEFNGLREACAPLVTGAVGIPAMSMRSGPLSLLPLLRHWEELKILAGQGKVATGDFAPFLDGPNFVVTDPWLRAWLDALAFSLSGLPAAQVCFFSFCDSYCFSYSLFFTSFVRLENDAFISASEDAFVLFPRT